MDTVIRTVGHSNRSLAEFLDLLAAHRIETVVDVRSIPWSRRWPWFRKRALGAALERAGIGYRYRGHVLGGRAERPRVGDFEAAVAELLALAGGTRLALMCAEADPARCHRAVLLAPAVERHGGRVVHLLARDRAEAHRVTAARRGAASPVMRDLFA